MHVKLFAARGYDQVRLLAQTNSSTTRQEAWQADMHAGIRAGVGTHLTMHPLLTHCESLVRSILTPVKEAMPPGQLTNIRCLWWKSKHAFRTCKAQHIGGSISGRRTE